MNNKSNESNKTNNYEIISFIVTLTTLAIIIALSVMPSLKQSIVNQDAIITDHKRQIAE